MNRSDAQAKLGRLCMTNAEALLTSLHFCANDGIGCFRINSQILPLKTHPLDLRVWSIHSEETRLRSSVHGQRG